jgi:hypothetical protein
MINDSDGEWIAAERKHEREMTSMMNEDRRRRRETVTERVVAVSWALGIAVVVCAVAALVYFWQHDAGTRGQQAELACLNNGGTWTSIGGSTSDVCLYLKEVPNG